MRAVSMAQLGRLDDARQILQSARADGSRLAQIELACERTRLESEYGSLVAADQALQVLDAPEAVSGHRGIWNLFAGQIALRRGDPALALAMVDRLATDPCVDAGGKLRGQLVLTRACIGLRRPDQGTQARETLRIATAQRSAPGIRIAELLIRIAENGSIDDQVLQAAPAETFVWSLIAEDVADYVANLSAHSLGRIQAEALARPERWQSALRLAVDKGGRSSAIAAGVLAEIGSDDDLAFLREVGASKKAMRPHALRIAKRLALPVSVMDLGVVEVSVGRDVIQRGLRRKVLALLCFLSSRPGMVSNRDEALEALWPELSPSAASNSLHQAIYFLRRLFEPGYHEGMSAGLHPL